MKDTYLSRLVNKTPDAITPLNECLVCKEDLCIPEIIVFIDGTPRAFGNVKCLSIFVLTNLLDIHEQKIQEFSETDLLSIHSILNTLGIDLNAK